MLVFALALRPAEVLRAEVLANIRVAIGPLLFSMIFLLNMVILNCIPDYFSYMKTRILLKKIATSESLSRILGFAALDTAVTALIFLIVIAPMLAFAAFAPSPRISPTRIGDLIFRGLTLHGFLPLGVCVA
jgi:hypothetical protein